MINAATLEHDLDTGVLSRAPDGVTISPTEVVNRARAEGPELGGPPA